MEQKKELTKKLIADSFISLMEDHPFDKITIRMITDQAGLIRPTFYNHFQDKYDLAEWIFVEDIINEVENLLSHGMVQEAVKYMFTELHKKHNFYSKLLLQATGQNSMEEVMVKHIAALTSSRITSEDLEPYKNNPILTPENISAWYAIGLVNCIKAWISSGVDATVEDEIQAYGFLNTHTLFDLINKNI